jgi:RNA polymerase sigma factor (sigma-70 family)
VSDPAVSDAAVSDPAVTAIGPVTGDDATLIARSRRDPNLFAAIYDRYFADIHHYLAGRLGPDAADDLAAETFLAAFGARDRFDPVRGTARPWLFGIATNLVARHRRAEARRYRAMARADGPADVGDDENQMAERLTAQRLRRPLAVALAGLPAGERDALLLVAVGGLSYEEVAAALGIPPGTVGSRLNRARQRVRQALASTESFTTEENNDHA